MKRIYVRLCAIGATLSGIAGLWFFAPESAVARPFSKEEVFAMFVVFMETVENIVETILNNWP